MRFLMGAVVGGFAVGSIAFWLFEQRNVVQAAAAFDEGVIHSCFNPGICPIQRGGGAAQPVNPIWYNPESPCPVGAQC